MWRRFLIPGEKMINFWLSRRSCLSSLFWKCSQTQDVKKRVGNRSAPLSDTLSPTPCWYPQENGLTPLEIKAKMPPCSTPWLFKIWNFDKTSFLLRIDWWEKYGSNKLVIYKLTIKSSVKGSRGQYGQGQTGHFILRGAFSVWFITCDELHSQSWTPI